MSGRIGLGALFPPSEVALNTTSSGEAKMFPETSGAWLAGQELSGLLQVKLVLPGCNPTLLQGMKLETRCRP